MTEPTVKKTDHDGSTFLVAYTDTRPTKISVKLNRLGANGKPKFYGWRPVWEDGKPMTDRDHAVLAAVSVSSDEEEGTE